MQRSIMLTFAFLLALNAGYHASRANDAQTSAAPVMVKLDAALPAAASPTATDASVPATQPASDAQAASDLSSTEKVLKGLPIPPGVDPNDPVSMLTAIYNAVKSGQWALLIGLIIMLVTWIVNNYLLRDRIPPKVLPWLAAGLGIAGYSALTLAAGSGWLQAILGGLQFGLLASGLYSMGGKYLLKKTSKE